MPGCRRRFHDLRETGITRDSRDLGAGHHGVPCLQVGKEQRPVHQVVRGLFHQAGLTAGINRQAQFFGRLHELVPTGRINADEAHHCVSDGVQADDCRPEREVEPMDRASGEHRRLLRALKGKALRRQLTDDDMQRRDQREADGERDRVGEGVARTLRQEAEIVNQRLNE